MLRRNRAVEQRGQTDAADNGQYVREDWTLFRSVRTISQLSGVPPGLLRRLVAKELTDNALDASGACRVGKLRNDGFYVEDDGPGIGGEPEEVARLFSFRRPLVSSKVKRLPMRGALGNGLRVVAGAVFASRGSLVVITNGMKLELSPQESGETLVRATRLKRTVGTRIELYLGDAISHDPDFLEWAETAISCAGDEPIYQGKTSAWWYDSDSFFELLKAARSRTVRDVMQDFDGSSVLDRGIAERFRGRSAGSLNYEEAEDLLGLARSSCNPVRPGRLTLLKKGLPGSYAKALGTLSSRSAGSPFLSSSTFRSRTCPSRRTARNPTLSCFSTKSARLLALPLRSVSGTTDRAMIERAGYCRTSRKAAPATRREQNTQRICDGLPKS